MGGPHLLSTMIANRDPVSVFTIPYASICGSATPTDGKMPAQRQLINSPWLFSFGGTAARRSLREIIAMQSITGKRTLQHR
jgi:hypothetical protein